jgi:hypothetical protein
MAVVGRRRMSAAVLFCAALLFAAAAGAAPFVPEHDQQILERLPPRSGSEWTAIAALHEQLERDPAAAPAVAAEVARRYLELFRVEGDARLVAYAQRELAPWSSLADPPVEIALLRAEIAQLEHRFAEAESDLQRLLERVPREPQAWLTLAAIELVRGDYANSRRACAKLVLLHDALVAGACLAAVQAATGEAAQALAFLERGLESAELEPALAAWLETLAAETAEALGGNCAPGSSEAAPNHHRAALASAMDGGSAGARPSVYSLVAYADCLLRGGEARAAQALLAAAPPADPILLRLAVAEKRLGEQSDARLEQLRFRLQLALEGRAAAHAREATYFALYLLEQPELALARALDNWEVQREPIDARLVLESALASGRHEAARPVVDWLAVNGVEHADLKTLIARFAP